MKVGQALRAVSYRLAVQYKSAGSPRNAAVMATNSADQSRPFLDQKPNLVAFLARDDPGQAAAPRRGTHQHGSNLCSLRRFESPFDIRATPVFILYYQEPCDALVTRAL